MSTPALNPLVEKIRATYPGQYDDMDDATLTKAVLAKYPQYSDLAAPKIGGQQGMAPAPRELQRGMVQTNQGAMLYGKAVAAGPNQPAGQAESAMGFGQTLGQTGRNLAGAAGATALGAAGAPILAAGADAALPFLRQTARQAVKYSRAHPIQTFAAIEAAKQLPGAAGRIAARVPSWLPFLAGNPEAGAAAESEAGTEAASTDQLPGRPYQPNPRYQAPPEPEPLPPRNGPLLLQGNVDQPPAPPPVTREQVGRAVNESLDVTPPTPGEPIYNRLPFAPKPEPVGETVPAGHTATPGSSALSSYHYDPASGEFTAIFKGGQTGHVYGGISPEQVQYLEQAPSKGKAFQAIKNSGVPVAKIVNGKRIELPRQVPTGDLTNILTRSLRQVQGNQ